MLSGKECYWILMAFLSSSWMSPDGQEFFVRYIADAEGYRVVESNAVPVSSYGMMADGYQATRVLARQRANPTEDEQILPEQDLSAPDRIDQLTRMAYTEDPANAGPIATIMSAEEEEIQTQELMKEGVEINPSVQSQRRISSRRTTTSRPKTTTTTKAPTTTTSTSESAPIRIATTTTTRRPTTTSAVPSTTVETSTTTESTTILSTTTSEPTTLLTNAPSTSGRPLPLVDSSSTTTNAAPTTDSAIIEQAPLEDALALLSQSGTLKVAEQEIIDQVLSTMTEMLKLSVPTAPAERQQEVSARQELIDSRSNPDIEEPIAEPEPEPQALKNDLSDVSVVAVILPEEATDYESDARV